MVKPIPGRSKSSSRSSGQGAAVCGIAAGRSHRLHQWTRRAGDLAPDFHLPSRDGQGIALSQKLAGGPVVLSFLHGAEAQVIRSQLDAVTSHSAGIVRLGASILVLAPVMRPVPEPIIPFDLLHDDGSIVAGIYGLYAPVAGEPSRHTPALRDVEVEQSFMPATFVVDRDSRIVMSLADAAFDNGIVPANVISTLIALRRRKDDRR